MTYLTRSKAQNAAIWQSQANDRHAIKQWALMAVGGFTGALMLTVELMPMPIERTYDLIQIDATGESEIVDYNLTATDCGLFKARLDKRGYHVLCEVAE